MTSRQRRRPLQRKTPKPVRDAILYLAESLEKRVLLSTTISIADSSAIEPGPGGTVNMDFTATRTGDLTSQVMVGYTTVAGTAEPTHDFTPETGTATFASGSATATIAIPIFNDGNFNSPNLTFSVQLTGITSVVGPPVTLAGQQIFGTGSGPATVTTADVNGDGKPDLIVANDGSNTVSVLLNLTAPESAAPSFAAQQTFATGAKPYSVTAADVNGDGKPDLIVANFISNTVSVLLNTTAPGATSASFATQQTFATGTGPISVTAADVNGDGKPDLVVANFVSNTVSVLLNTTTPGSATASFATQQPFATTNPRSVTAADVNGDGKPDLLVANYNSNTVSVLLNATAPGSATASFAAQQTFATGREPSSVVATDVNGDGKPDLIVANYASNTVSVLLNATAAGSATASFATQQTFATGTAPTSVMAADVNGDGKPDLLVANYNSNTVSVLLNATAPGAAAPSFVPQQTFAAGTKPFSVAAADVNGDGKPDLLVANYGSSSVSVLPNTTVLGAATVTPAFPQTAFATGTGPTSVTAADVNGDGKPDLIVANRNDYTVSVMLNTTPPGAATPTFAAQQTFATGSDPYSVAVADVNGDGEPDLIVANAGSNTVSVLLNTTTPGATMASFATQQTFATGGFPKSVTAADLNGDGKPDLIVADNDAKTVSVLLNTTTPGSATASFAALKTFATGSYPSSVTTADVNGDGKPDLIVANGASGSVSVLLNTTTPGAVAASFAAQQTFATGAVPNSVTAADVNGDGKPDLIVANYKSKTVSVLLNTTVPGSSTASFATQQTFATGTEPFSVTAADVNGDGKPDLLVANYGSNGLSVLLNTTAPGATSPAFATQQTFATGSEPQSVTAADVNGDGRPDLLIANRGNNTVSVLLNTPVTIATGTATGTIVDLPATATVVTSGGSPSASGQSVTFTATVTPASGTFDNGGTVQFQIDGANAGSPVTLSGGVATFTTSSLSAGNHTVVATYSGDGNFSGSISASFTQTVATAPEVTGVSVDSTSWKSAFPEFGGYTIPTGAAQLNDLPWINLNEVHVTFNEAVNVTQASLTVAGVNQASYAFSNFSYNSATFTATWTFAANLGDDRLLLDLAAIGPSAVTSTSGLALDGTWNNGSSAFPSGAAPAAPGTDFKYNLNVLPGDVSQTGSVNILEVIKVRNAQLTSPGAAGYSPFYDVTGAGAINILDVIDVRNRQLTSLPSGTP